MLNEGDAEKVFEKLSSILREAELGWVVDQVNEEVALGKLEAKRVKVTQELGDPDFLVSGNAARPRARSEVFTESVPYSGREKLVLLVRGARRATVELLDIYAAAMQFADRARRGSAPGTHAGIQFRSEDSQAERRFSIAESDIGQGKATVLRDLLHELEREIS